MFNKLHASIVGAAGVVAVIPGAGLMVGAIELPIEFDKALGYMAAVVGPMVFYIVFLAKRWILKVPGPALIMLIFSCGICGLVLGYATNGYAQAHIGEYPYVDDSGERRVERYIAPDRYGPPLQVRLIRDGHNLDNVLKRDRKGTLALLRVDAAPVRLKMAIGFLGAQALLIFSFLCAAWAAAQAPAGIRGRNESRAVD